jgi:aspartate/methionine/tyrosine aminotransferase
VSVALAADCSSEWKRLSSSEDAAAEGLAVAEAVFVLSATLFSEEEDATNRCSFVKEEEDEKEAARTRTVV